VIFLQHPSERRKAIGTARIAHLALEGSSLWVEEEFSNDPRVQAVLEDPGNQCLLLYPGPESTLATQFSAEPRLKTVVFVLDGTWRITQQMLRRSPCLQGLPQIRFSPQHPSQYRIRKQPEPHCLSTVEAVSELLFQLEGDPRAQRILNPFQRMVERQIRIAEEWTERRKLALDRAPRRLGKSRAEARKP
jgi:DTW domain-containing protein YfiP